MCVCVHSCILNMHIILWVCVYICGMYDILGMHGMYLYLYAFICVLMPMYHNMCKHYAKYVYVCTFFTHVLYLFMHNYISDLCILCYCISSIQCGYTLQLRVP